MDITPDTLNAVAKREIATTAAFTLTVGHVGKLSALAEKLGKNKSETIREAIDRMYAETFPIPVPHTTE